MSNLVLNVSLAQYASSEEHAQHAAYAKLLWQYHHAIAKAMELRSNPLHVDIASALEFEKLADEHAQEIERLEKMHKKPREAWMAEEFRSLLFRHQVVVQSLNLQKSEIKIVLARIQSPCGYRGTGQDRVLGKAFEMALDELTMLEARDLE